MNSIIRHFDKYLPLDQQEIDALTSRLIERKVKRKQFILQEGDICKYFTYVVEGCFKMYGVDNSGADHNLVFATQDDWISDIGSLHNETPSQLYIEAVEPSVILQLSKADLWYLYTNFPKFDQNFSVIIKFKYIELQNRLLETFSANAQERYKSFLKQYPNMPIH